MSLPKFPESELFIGSLSDQERVRYWLIWLLITIILSVNATLLPLSYRSNEKLVLHSLQEIGYQPHDSEIHLTPVNPQKLDLILKAIIFKSHELPPELEVRILINLDVYSRPLNYYGYPHELIITQDAITITVDEVVGPQVIAPDLAMEYLTFFKTFPSYSVRLLTVSEQGRIQAQDSFDVVASK
ncbi:MAG TPA: hypothetical protein VF209_01260 [Patescibacteria group bacterium]